MRSAVRDALGQMVTVLHNGRQLDGAHTATFDAGELAAGVYLVRLVAGDVVRTRALVVAR